MHSSEIPVAHTPPGGYGATFPPLILGDCTEPLVAGAPDMRGVWKTVSATRGGVQVQPDDRLMSYTERIEQCGNRIVDCGGGTIAECRADGTEEHVPAKCEGVKVHKGDLLYFNTWGGGGWGDPLQRDPAIVASDVDKKLVSAEGAKRYGVILNDDLSVDQSKTDELRAEMSKDTVPDEMFNFGGTIEEIKARCLEETHLEPPVSPTFLKQ